MKPIKLMSFPSKVWKSSSDILRTAWKKLSYLDVISNKYNQQVTSFIDPYPIIHVPKNG